MNDVAHPGFRIFVLGAGFSVPAGLPLATELYPLVRSKIELQHGVETKLHRDIENYLRYCSDCGIEDQNEETLDLELFMSYLDIEHYLGLRGSDTWSQEGNESQLMIRKAIGAVIHEHTPPADSLPEAYYEFAKNLSVHDIVVTFNYDLVLENALQHVGKPFRRYPYRYKSVSNSGGTLDSEVEEVILLKLHGSIDWFDNRQFLESKASLEAQGVTDLPIHSVFDDPERYSAKPLVDGILPDDDTLKHIHFINRVGAYYETDGGFNAPFILSPSHVKFVYSEPILSFWNGLGRSGGYNLGVSIIGFSLPPHDEYIRIGLYQMISNYWSWWDTELLDVLKDYVRFVDYKEAEADKEAYLERYRFTDTDRSKFFFEGFSNDAIDFLFNQRRET